MKKFLSLLLAAVMVCSCAVALAARYDDPVADGTNATLRTGLEEAPFLVDYSDKNNPTASQRTDLWIQVDAIGQIDATVPLVLVFKTNIDGGEATTGSNYGITNQSSADLVVTQIDTTEYAPEINDKNEKMTLVKYDGTLNRDNYAVLLTTTAEKGTGASTTGWDLYTKQYKNDKLQGGLFELKRGEYTAIDASMKTGELSFVTSRKEGTGENAGKDAGMDETKGVKLLTVAYTVAIDTSDAKGDVILGAYKGTESSTNVDGNFTANNMNYTYQAVGAEGDEGEITVFKTQIPTP